VPAIAVDAHVSAPPAAVFDYLHDPAQRPVWDPMVEGATLQSERLRPGARLLLRGRRKAPSWTGEYRRLDRPLGSELVLVEGTGMPFRSFRQSVALRADGSGSQLRYTVAYELPPLLRPIDVFTFRGRLTRAARQAVSRVEQHFA
jgi:hypothetical protein